MILWLKLVAGLAAALLGTLAVSAARIPSAPDLFLFPVAFAARGGHPLRAMLTGLAAGLLEDSLVTPPRLLGFHAFSKILIGYLLATIESRVIIERPAALGALLAGSAAAEQLVLAGLLWFLRGEFVAPQVVEVLPRALTTGLIAFVLMSLFRVPWRFRLFSRRGAKLVS
jgi:rod shape-determining protein MreD